MHVGKKTGTEALKKGLNRHLPTKQPSHQGPLHSESAYMIATRHRRLLVIGDTHLGMDFSLMESGIHIPNQTESMLSHLERICKDVRPTDLVHLGDLKHTIFHPPHQEIKAVEQFLELALSFCENIDIVPGNHDGGLKKILEYSSLLQRIRLHTPRGFSSFDTGLVHGHTWPSTETMYCRLILLSHLHPAVRLKDTLGGGTTEPCWAKGRINQRAMREHYYEDGRDVNIRNRSYVIVPAFNPLCGSALNAGRGRKPLSPLTRNGLINLEKSEIYLSDGTNLGKLSDLPR